MSGPELTRRALLRGGVALGAVGSLAGCNGRTEDGPTPEGRSPPVVRGPVRRGPPTLSSLRGEYETVVDMGRESAVRDDRPLNRALDAHAADDTLIYLPRGRYTLDDTWSFDEFERFGLLGDGATIVPPEGFDTTLFDIGSEEDATAFRFAGIDFDFSAPSTGARPLFAAIETDLLVSDVTVRGTQDVDQDLFRFDVTDEDGLAEITRLSLPDGGDPEWGITGCEVGDMNRGDLRFVDCHIAGFPDNGLYADPPEGTVSVVGGRYENSNVSNVRLNADPGSVVRGVHIRCDTATEGFENMRGLRLRGGDGIAVESCLIEMLDVTASDGAIAISHDMGRASIENTHVHVDADDVSGLRLKSFSGDDDAGRITVNNLLITGDASGGAAIQASDRNGYEFENVCVLQYGDDRDGLYADTADGAFRDSTVAVRGDVLHLESSDVETSNLRVCRNPRQDNGIRQACEQSCRRLDRRLRGTVPTSEVSWYA